MSRHRRHHKENAEEQNNMFNIGNIAEVLKNINADEVSSLLNKENAADNDDKNMGRQEIISSIRTLLNSDKTELIRVLIEIYGVGKNKLKI